MSDFIERHLNSDVKQLALNASKYPDIDVKAAATLISLYQKAKIKLPVHYKFRAALNAKSFEQSTSESVAELKAREMDLESKKILNLCGGLGVDDWAFSTLAKHIDSCEIDPDIHEIALFNLGRLGIKNVKRHLCDGIEFLKTGRRYDLIYLDPDRRPGEGRVFKLEHCRPDVLSNIERMLSLGGEVWVKLSPLIDLTYLKNTFPQLSRILVISFQEEVKELLICLKISSQKNKSPQTEAIKISPKGLQKFKSGKAVLKPEYSSEGQYLYEPDNSIIKAELAACYAAVNNLKMLGPNTYFFVSDLLLNNFMGRTFKVLQKIVYKPKFIQEYLKMNQIDRADITVRNFLEKPDDLRKRYGLKKPGKNFLFFATDMEGKRWMYHLLSCGD
ncbi:MAG: class I SAM-dependent methyltransferase [Flavobacteriales bacterium]|nr:class I SAM-dependent methyltransferase [Flavobacteriales bacterium]